MAKDKTKQQVQQKGASISWFWSELSSPLPSSKQRSWMQWMPPEKLGAKTQEIRLLAYALCTYAVKEVFDISIRGIDWKTGKNGRPYLSPYPEIDINLSHSGSVVACGVGMNEVGVDVQKMAKKPSDALIRRICTPDEQRWIEENYLCRAERFTQLWALKESYLKCTGNGLSESMNTFTCYVSQHGIVSDVEERYNFHIYQLKPDYYAALCTEGKVVSEPKYVDLC